MVLDSLLFRTGWYRDLLEPESTAGRLWAIVGHERSATSSGQPRVLALGDSRMRFQPILANRLGLGVQFSSIAVPGTLPRVWYYMLREVDPHADRYSAILLPADDYGEEDWEDLSTRVSDITYTAPLLRWADAWEFTLSYPLADGRWRAAKASLLKGAAYARDFQDFLVHSRRRRREAAQRREALTELIATTQWSGRSMAGLQVDWKNWTIQFPPGLSETERQVCRDVLLRGTAEQKGYLAAYRRHWWGRIVDHYRGSKTRVVFLRLPRGPVVRPELVARRTHVVRELATRPQVRVLDEHLFDTLERPELFGDPLHLNAAGSELFTSSLAHTAATLIREAHGAL